MDNQCLHPAAHENPCHGQIWFLLRISNPRGVVQWSTSILIESYRLMFIWRFAPFIYIMNSTMSMHTVHFEDFTMRSRPRATYFAPRWMKLLFNGCSRATGGDGSRKGGCNISTEWRKVPKKLYDVWFGNCFAHTNAFEHGIEGGLQQDMGQSVGLYPPVVDRHPLHGQNLALPH